MICNRCGAEILNGSKFCNNCGNKISNEDEVNKVILNKNNLEINNANMYGNQNTYPENQKKPYYDTYTSLNNAPPPYNTQNSNYSGNYYAQPTYFNQYEYNKRSDNLGVISLCLGIGSIVCFQPLGIASIIVGIIKLNKKDGQDKELCIAGIITGAIGVLLTILFVCFFLIGVFADDSTNTSNKYKNNTYPDSHYYDDSSYDDSYDL